MKERLKFLLMTIMLVCSIFILAAWKANGALSYQAKGEWKAPASADNIKNPLKGDATATEAGQKLFKQLCAICHGNKGKGDGMAGMSLTPRPANFTSAKVQSQSEGAIYWKMTEGRTPMASYKTILKEEQRWQLVNYIKTLKK